MLSNVFVSTKLSLVCLEIFLLSMYIYSYYFLKIVFEITLLNYENPCRNWTFQRFAVVEEKNEE